MRSLCLALNLLNLVPAFRPPNHPGHCQASLVPSAAEEAAKVKAQTEAMAAKLAQARQEMEQLKAA